MLFVVCCMLFVFLLLVVCGLLGDLCLFCRRVLYFVCGVFVGSLCLLILVYYALCVVCCRLLIVGFHGCSLLFLVCCLRFEVYCFLLFVV